MFCMRNKDNIFPIRTLIWRPERVCVFPLQLLSNSAHVGKSLLVQVCGEIVRTENCDSKLFQKEI